MKKFNVVVNDNEVVVSVALENLELVGADWESGDVASYLDNKGGIFPPYQIHADGNLVTEVLTDRLVRAEGDFIDEWYEFIDEFKEGAEWGSERDPFDKNELDYLKEIKEAFSSVDSSVSEGEFDRVVARPELFDIKWDWSLDGVGVRERIGVDLEKYLYSTLNKLEAMDYDYTEVCYTTLRDMVSRADDWYIDFLANYILGRVDFLNNKIS